MISEIHDLRLNYAYQMLRTAGSLFSRDELRHVQELVTSPEDRMEFETRDNSSVLEKSLARAFEELGRVEEFSSSRRDDWGRFPYSQSSSSSCCDDRFQNPPVNLCMLTALDHTVANETTSKWFGDKDFCIALTHDVDLLAHHTLRGVAGDFKRLAYATLYGKWSKAYFYSRALLNTPLQTFNGSDPFFNIKQIALQERELGFDSSFYFLFAHKHKLDGAEVRTYERLLGKAVQDALEAGCEVGVHGSTLAAEEFDELIFERERCQQMTGAKDVGLRFHNLRLDVRWSFNLIEKSGFIYDTTLGFPEKSGWRNGFSFPYRPYNFRLERAYNFIEIPLVIMDITFALERYRNLPVNAARDEIFQLLEIFKHWRGAGAISWHNTMFDPHLSQGYVQLYWDVLKWIAENNGIGVSTMRLAKEWQRREKINNRI